MNKKLILPSDGGVANLEIRRVQNELDSSSVIEMDGHRPAALVGPAVSALKAVITAIERGEVSSLCVVAVMPKSSVVAAGTCFIGATGKGLGKIDELFHVSMDEQYERLPLDDEAG